MEIASIPSAPFRLGRRLLDNQFVESLVSPNPIERYVGMVANFASVAVVSRLLTPQEVGLMAVGVAVVTLVVVRRLQHERAAVPVDRLAGDAAGVGRE